MSSGEEPSLREEDLARVKDVLGTAAVGDMSVLSPVPLSPQPEPDTDDPSNLGPGSPLSRSYSAQGHVTFRTPLSDTTTSPQLDLWDSKHRAFEGHSKSSRFPSRTVNHKSPPRPPPPDDLGFAKALFRQLADSLSAANIPEPPPLDTDVTVAAALEQIGAWPLRKTPLGSPAASRKGIGARDDGPSGSSRQSPIGTPPLHPRTRGRSGSAGAASLHRPPMWELNNDEPTSPLVSSLTASTANTTSNHAPSEDPAGATSSGGTDGELSSDTEVANNVSLGQAKGWRRHGGSDAISSDDGERAEHSPSSRPGSATGSPMLTAARRKARLRARAASGISDGSKDRVKTPRSRVASPRVRPRSGSTPAAVPSYLLSRDSPTRPVWRSHTPPGGAVRTSRSGKPSLVRPTAEIFTPVITSEDVPHAAVMLGADSGPPAPPEQVISDSDFAARAPGVPPPWSPDTDEAPSSPAAHSTEPEGVSSNPSSASKTQLPRPVIGAQHSSGGSVSEDGTMALGPATSPRVGLDSLSTTTTTTTSGDHATTTTTTTSLVDGFEAIPASGVVPVTAAVVGSLAAAQPRSNSGKTGTGSSTLESDGLSLSPPTSDGAARPSFAVHRPQTTFTESLGPRSDDDDDDDDDEGDGEVSSEDETDRLRGLADGSGTEEVESDPDYRSRAPFIPPRWTEVVPDNGSGGFGASLGPPGASTVEIAFEEFVLKESVGIGGFGEVFRGLWRQTDVAVKRLLVKRITPNDVAAFREEIAIHAALRHPNIVMFLGACTAPPNLAIVTEFCDRGSLFDVLHDETLDLPWDLRLRLALGAATGMNYLHCNRPHPVIHRDLKSLNVLVDSHWTAKVTDFGYTRVKATTYAATQCGTPAWMAPELLRNEKYTEKVDVYSFGIVMWEIVTRQLPYEDVHPLQVVGLVGYQNPPKRPDIPTGVPEPYLQLMQACWADNPDERPSFHEIVEQLRAMM